MDPWYLNIASLLVILDAIKTNVLDTTVLKLFKNDITVNQNTVIGDLDEADFDGYAAVTLTTWATPYVNSAGKGVILAGQKQFNGGAPFTTTNLIYGYWVETGTGDLVAVGRFADAPRPMGEAGTALLVNANYEVQPAGPF